MTEKKNYTVIVDSSVDMPKDILDEWGVKVIDMKFRYKDDMDTEYSNADTDLHEFYDNLRDGRDAKTTAINSAEFIQIFREELEKGRDILYIGFSSGLSSTYNQSRMAASQLRREYPDRKIVTVDSLCESAGYALFVRLVLNYLDEESSSLDDAKLYAKEMREHICHWFTVDDLQFLKRGGRVGATAAFVGTALGIKPILHMDSEGHLVNVFNVRGRKNAIKALAQKIGELTDGEPKSPVYISHGDCFEDALLLESMIKDMYGTETDIISGIGPVIGSHSGPDTLALYFVGKEK